MESLRSAMHAEASNVPPLGDIDRAIQHVTIVRRRWAGVAGLAAAMVGLVVALNGSWWQPGVVQPVAPQPTSTSASRHAAPASTLVASIPIKGRDVGIAVDPGTNTVLVACSDGLNMIDMATRTVVGIVGMPGGGRHPWDVAVDAEAGLAYVTYTDSAKVGVLDTATWEGVGWVEVGGGFPAAVDPVGRAVYVGSPAAGTVSVIDTRTRHVVDAVRVADTATGDVAVTGPWGLAVDPRSGDVYVANGHADTVSVIDRDSHRVVKTIAGLDDPQAVAVDPATREAYVTNAGDGTVSVIDTRTHKLVDTIEGVDGGGVAVDPTAGVVYVNGDGLTVIDTRTHKVIDTIEGSGGGDVAVDPTSGDVYATNGDHGHVSVFGAP